VTTASGQEVAAARARAIRVLLARPLLDRRAGADFSEIIAHAEWLQRWFDEKCGWTLVVDARHGFARLRKIPTNPSPRRGTATRRSTPRPFTRRRYALLAVIAAVLSDTSRPQISLQDIAGRVRTITVDAGTIREFTPRRDERIALVDAVTLLVDLGVLSVVETRGDYASDQEANALYDIDDRRLGHLISAPYPPSLATSVEHLMHESRYGPWIPPVASGSAQAEEGAGNTGAGAGVTGSPALERARKLAAGGAPGASEEQLRRRARHRVMRILLDDPVLYLESLEPAERTYLQQAIGGITNWAAEAGMVLERRSEGWALIDPDNIATDMRFPEGNDQVKFAALLLLSALQPEDVPAGSVRLPRNSAERVIAARLRANPTWARAYQIADGAAQLASAALDLLADLGLAVIDHAGFTLLSAVGRYRPSVSDIAPAEGTGGAASASTADRYDGDHAGQACTSAEMDQEHAQ
jgi:uncharacterized protein (TIGR02678 family)